MAPSHCVSGLKQWVERHSGKLTWVDNGKGGMISLASESSFKRDDMVVVKTEKPALGWGGVHPWSVGKVREQDPRSKLLIVDFPEKSGWKGGSDEFVLLSNVKTLPGAPEGKDSRFDKAAFVKLDGKGTVSFTGREESVKGPHKEYGFVRGAQKLSPKQPYFEICIVKDRGIGAGIGVGLCAEEPFAGAMPGWPMFPSIGFHSDDGNLFTQSGRGQEFGQPSSTGDTLGCGILFSSHGAAETVFFTRNGVLVGWVPLADGKMLYPIVGSVGGAEVVVDLTASFSGARPACKLIASSGSSSFSNLRLALESIRASISISGPKKAEDRIELARGAHAFYGTVKISEGVTITTEEVAAMRSGSSYPSPGHSIPSFGRHPVQGGGVPAMHTANSGAAQTNVKASEIKIEKRAVTTGKTKKRVEIHIMEGKISRKRKEDCFVDEPTQVWVSRDVFEGDWDGLKVGDSIAIEAMDDMFKNKRGTRKDLKAISAQLKKSGTLEGSETKGSATKIPEKAVVSAPEGWVLKVTNGANLTLRSVSIKSLGGDDSANATAPGAAGGVFVYDGSVQVEACSISSENGSAVYGEGDNKVSRKVRVTVRDSDIGPCGRHGVVVNKAESPTHITGTSIHDCAIFGAAINPGSQCLLEKCTIKDSKIGVGTFGTVRLSKVSISECDRGIVVNASSSYECADCVIEECPTALYADGHGAVINWGKSNLVKSCGKLKVERDEGVVKIESGDAESPTSQKSPVASSISGFRSARNACFDYHPDH
jgi:hypothetical protein